MKIILNRSQVVWFDNFPYDFKRWDYDQELLRNILYAPDDPDLCDDDHVCVMDADGIEEWIHSYDDDTFDNTTGMEYIPYHLGRTIEPVASIFLPIVFINCSSAPYVQQIMNHTKIYETRTRNTLGSLEGLTVLIAETGHGKSIVRCSAQIHKSFKLTTPSEWECFRYYTEVPEGSPHDWKPATRVKWLYELTNVCPVDPFHPAEGVRHGRTWMEYNGRGM